MRRLALIALLLFALALAACGDDEESGEPAGGETAVEAPASGRDGSGAEARGDGARERGAAEDGGGSAGGHPGIEITTAESQFGEILFDADDRAIYLFDKESGSESECYGECAVAWPPVLTEGDPQAVGGAEAKLLGTTERDDGTTQVTYNGHPLYYYVDDPPGQVLCHNVDEFGGLWLVLEPSGEAVA